MPFQGRLGGGSPGLPPTLPAPSPSALSSSASATFHTSTPTATGSAIKNSTSAASFTTHAVVEPRSFGPQTLPLRSQVPCMLILSYYHIQLYIND